MNITPISENTFVLRSNKENWGPQLRDLKGKRNKGWVVSVSRTSLCVFRHKAEDAITTSARWELLTSNCTCVGTLFIRVFAPLTHRKYQNTPFPSETTYFSETFMIRELVSSFIPTFLTLPSASTSGCENFSLKVFTPANLEESRAIAAILRSSSVRARNHPLQNHVT